MTACCPRPIPAEPGCLAIRVAAPETPAEQAIAAAMAPEMSLYRLVLWIGGHAYLSCAAAAEPPTLAQAMSFFNDGPLYWAELLRKPAA